MTRYCKCYIAEWEVQPKVLERDQTFERMVKGTKLF